LDGFFDVFLDQFVIPAIVKGLFRPDDRFDHGFKLIVAGLANIPVGHVKIIAPGNGLFNGVSANIACKGFHIILLIVKLPIYMVHRIKKKVEGFKDGI
jgi:hypothetical protein